MTPTDIRHSWITAQADRTEHAVTYDAQVAGMAAGDGRYVALCGIGFLAGPMETAPSGECSSCVTFLRARTELRDLEQRMNERRPRWFSSLFCRHKQPADVGRKRPPTPTSAGTHRRHGRHSA